jgi:hypothetical protein
MRAFSYSLLKLVEVLKELISLGSVYEEEDHQPLICGFRCGRAPDPQGADSLPPPPSMCSEDRKNHLNEEITPLLPTGIGERFRQTISNLEHDALLRRYELPL